MLQKSKNLKKVVILLPILILAITCYYFIHNFKAGKNLYSDDTKVMNTLTQVLNLSTVKYNYSNVITVKKEKSINDIIIPFTEKSFIIKYNGVINGGIKPENLSILKCTKEEISIEINKCEILDHYIDSDNIYVYDVKSSIFNKLDTQEVLDDINNSKDEYEEKALEEGLMDEIKESSKKSIEGMLKNIGYKKVSVNFK